MQRFERRREALNRIVNVQYVFGSVLSSSLGLDQLFLNDETRRVGNLNPRWPRQRDALFLTNRDRPRFDKQDVELAQFLRRHPQFAL